MEFELTESVREPIVNAWVLQWFATQQETNGGVIRRNRGWVDKLASVGQVIAEAQRRGYHVLETGDQVVVLCHQGELIIHC